MKVSLKSVTILSGVSFSTSLTTQSYLSSLSASIPVEPDEGNALYDPLGLYPRNSVEKQRIQPLEVTVDSAPIRSLIDPLNLYKNDVNGETIEFQSDMSESLPFLTRPQHLDGTMVGDVGFDPLGLAARSKERLGFMRRAELKHARIAMLAAVGWPAAEWFHNNLAYASGVRSSLVYGDRVPSVLNGGLLRAVQPCWPFLVAALTLASVVEVFEEYYRRETEADSFDYEEKVGANDMYLALAEMKNGRLAMMAVVAYAVQEAFTDVGIVPQMLSWAYPHDAQFLTEEGFTSNVQAILSGLF